jgi:hypothetical protein
MRLNLPGVDSEAPPYGALALAVASMAVWVAWQAGAVSYAQLVVVGPLGGQWWRLATSLFAYPAGLTAYVYGFMVLTAVFVFGWLVERRHGGLVVLALFFGAGVAGAAATLGVYPTTGIVAGADGPALALLLAWAVPDILAARRGSHYEGDLLAAGAVAAALLLMPFARPEVSWLSALVGAVLGLVVGFGLAGLADDA